MSMFINYLIFSFLFFSFCFFIYFKITLLYKYSCLEFLELKELDYPSVNITGKKEECCWE